MPEREEIIGRFRNSISSRYRWYGWIAGVIWLAGVLVNVFIDESPLASVVSNGLILFGSVMLWYCFNHRYHMLYYFNTIYPDPVAKLSRYFEQQQSQWEKYSLLRIGLMCLLGMGMMLCLVFWPANPWTRIT